MKESGAKAHDPRNALVAEGLPGELCYIYENTIFSHQLAELGELC